MIVRMFFASFLVLISVVGCGGDGSSQQTNTAAGQSNTTGAIYASPSGFGTACTLDAPCSITAAQQLARAACAHAAADVTVYLRGGTYLLSEPLTFDSRDSATNGFRVVYQAYRAETPVISGGRKITGWTQVPGSAVWQAAAPAGIVPRQLYVNGQRTVRASSAASILGTLTKTAYGYTTANTTIQSWRNPSTIEFVYTGNPNAGSAWTQSRCGVASITAIPGGSAITMQQPCWNNATTQKPPGQFIVTPDSVENVYDLLGTPGQWYLDQATSTIYYTPDQGVSMDTAEVIAPMLDQLLIGSGASNLKFSNLVFAYGTWSGASGPDGFVEVQANVRLVGAAAVWQSSPANVAFHSSSSISFERCVFTHLGAGGLVIDQGSKNSSVIGSVFTDISGTAVRIGDIDAPNATTDQQDSGTTITDNYIHAVAVEFHGGVGIFAGYVANTLISHNELFNLPYTAISVGWGWGENSYAENNQISYNHIHHHMQMLVDGGAVYTLSAQGLANSGWSSVHHNYIHDQANNFGALYFDEGSAYISAYSNVVASSPYWVSICEPSVHNINVTGNFTDDSAALNDGTATTLANNIVSATWGQDAQSIISSAGLESAYADIAN